MGRRRDKQYYRLFVLAVGNHRGVTLLEVITTLVLVVMLTMGFHYVFVTPLEWVSQSGREARAGHLAFSLLELVRAQVHSCPGEDLETIIADPDLQGLQELQGYFPAGMVYRLESSTRPDLGSIYWYEVRARVTWQQGNREQEVNLVTLIHVRPEGD